MTDALAKRIAEVDLKISVHEATCLEQAKANNAALKILQDGHLDIVKRLDALNAAGWRVVLAVLLPLVGLFAWLFVQVWPTHQTGAYTQQDAAHDAAAAEARAAARDEAMLHAIEGMRK